MEYNSLLNTKTSDKWKRIGIQKRAGVALPLFSIYSKKSLGIGEIPDLRLAIDWCKINGMSIMQLLPLNEVGYDFAPYNAISTFAIEPMYLSIGKLRKADLRMFRKQMLALKKAFPKGNTKVNYDIKIEKLKLLRDIFKTIDLVGIPKFQEYVRNNIQWLKYYSLFKILKDLNEGKSWPEWNFKHKYISYLLAEKTLHEHKAEAEFYYWIQWQLYEQLLSVKRYAGRKEVFIMGDLPFLVSRNSADVWAYKNYFKLDLSSGAPPDMYFSKGQRWGMPPYNWENISADNYGYIKERLRYSENFFDMFRIDHFIGLFRIWTVDLKTPEEYGGLYGKFNPDDEHLWEQHGRTILTVMINSTSMLPCAEDLGTVPLCSAKVLEEFGIPGLDIQRWGKVKGNFDFLPAEQYRLNSVASVSTHDSSSLPFWWENEAGTIDELSFQLQCEKHNIRFEKYNWVVKELFEEKRSANERLYWRKEISNVYVLLEILKLNYSQAKEITDMYLYSIAEKRKFWKYIGMKGEYSPVASKVFIKHSLEKINSSNSIFSIQLLTEYLYLDENILKNFSSMNYRINFPGTVNADNWSLVLPFSMEELINHDINEIIKNITTASGRV